MAQKLTEEHHVVSPSPNRSGVYEFNLRSLPDWVWALAALCLLVGIGAIFRPSLLRPDNIFNILRQNCFVGVVALGMTLVIIGGGIDLSVGSLVALAGVSGVWAMNSAIQAEQIISSAQLSEKIHIAPDDSALTIFIAQAAKSLHLAGSEPVGIALAIIIAIFVGIAGGCVNGILIARGRLAPFIATLGTMAMFRSFALTLANGSEVRSASPEAFARFGQGGRKIALLPVPIPYPLIVFIIVAIFLAVILTRTRFGRYIYAIGGNERSAVYSAVNVKRVKFWTYAISGLTCGIAALMLSSWLNSVSSSQAGTLYELDAIAAVVIGGTRLQGGSGNIIGTVIGVLLLGVIGNILILLNVSSFLQGLVKGLIIIMAALAQRTVKSEN